MVNAWKRKDKGRPRLVVSRPEFYKVCVVLTSLWLPSPETVCTSMRQGTTTGQGEERRPLAYGIPVDLLKDTVGVLIVTSNSEKETLILTGQLRTSPQRRSTHHRQSYAMVELLILNNSDIIIPEHRSSSNIQSLGHYPLGIAKQTDNAEETFYLTHYLLGCLS